MVIVQANNTVPYSKEGNSYKLVSESLPPIVVQPKNDICLCDYIQCEYIEDVFAEVGGEDYKNDHSEFLFNRLVSTDTVSIKLLKGKQEVAILDDDTLGELFDGFPDGNSSQQRYYGFRLDWEKVLDVHGSGQYQVTADLSIAGTSSTFESRKYYLIPYSDLNANGTVKIESTQNGNIFGSEFDYTGLEWKQFVRVKGKFGNPTPTIEETGYTTAEKNYRQIKSKVTREWTLLVKQVSWQVAEQLVYNKIMANQILITDYDIKAENVWRNISVKTESIEKPELYNNPNKSYTIKFADTKAIFEKTNY